MQHRRTAHVLALALAMGALLSAYGCGQGPSDTGAVAAPPASTSPAPTPVKATASTRKAAVDATSLASALKVSTPHVWTAETDPNKLLGRPGQYTSAATVVDKRADCSDPKEPGASCGATVEVFASPDDAKARATYIDAAIKAVGDSEYHTVAGAALLRVTSELTPKQAAVYAERFQAAAAG